MNDNLDVPNPELREHVTDHSFVLTLKRTHIAMLIAVASNNFDAVHALRLSVPAAQGLKRRGLLLHATDRYGRPGIGEHYKYFPNGGRDKGELHNIYRLTKAGWAVFDLLVEAGLAITVDPRQRKVA